MGKIADLFFAAVLDDKRLQLDAKRSGDKAGATMAGSIRKAFSGSELGKGLVQGLGLAGALGAANLASTAVSGLISVMRDATTAALEEEASVAKLNAALQANVAGYDGNTDAIEKVLQSRLRLGFADDEQRSSLATLVSVTKDYNKALELQRIAMDLARLRGMDLQSAGDLIGKVYGGNIGILSRYGIQLEKGTTATEALAEIQKRAAGQAEAYAETNSGKLLASQVKVGEAMERFGEKTLPIVVGAAEAAAEAVEGLASVADLLSGQLPETEEGMDGLIDTINDLNPLAFGMNSAIDQSTAAMAAAEEKARELAGAERELADAGYTAAEGIRASGFEVAEASEEMASGLPDAIEAAKDEAVRIARMTPGELADALREKRTAWQDEVDQLGKDLEDEMTTAAEIAAIQGALAGQELADGLKSKDPIVRAQAENTRIILERRLAELREDARGIGSQTGSNYAGGLRGTTPQAASAGSAVAGAARPPLQGNVASARTWGYNTGAAYAAGLRATYGLVNDAAHYVAKGAVGPMKASSPPGPESPLHLIDKWGERTIEAWIGGILKGGRSVRDVMRSVAGQAAQGLTPNMPRWSLAGALTMPAAGAVPLSGGVTTSPGTVIHNHNLTVPIQGLLKARDAFEVSDRLQRLQENGVLDTPEEYS